MSKVNKSESKYFNTAVKMDEALLALLEKKDFQCITVKEICDMAEVNRSTFYLHYETVGDLLNETMELVMKRFEEKFATIERVSAEQIANIPTDRLVFINTEYLVPYLEFVKENQRVFNVAISRPTVIRTNQIFNHLYAETIYPIMKRFGLEEHEIKYKLSFYLQGIFAVICEWIKNGCTETVDVMADLLIRCIFPKKDFHYD